MAKSIPTYLPLKLIHGFDEVNELSESKIGWRYDEIKPHMEDIAKAKLPSSKEQFIEEISFVGIYVNENEQRNVPEYAKNLFLFMFEALEKSGYNLKQNTATALTDSKDSLVYPIIIEKWSENKQVYKPDKIFLEALLQTKNFSLTKYDIEHLPVNTFFIDLTEVTAVNPYAGVFVHVIPSDETVGIIFYLLTDDMSVFSHYIRCKYEEDGSLKSAIAELMNDEHQEKIGTDKELPVMGFSLDTDKIQLEKTLKSDFSRLDMTRLSLQLICYMSSKEPDIVESPTSKVVYKKPVGKPQNRFSEVQTHDVGIRYGNSIRVLLKEENKHKHKKNKSKSDDKSSVTHHTSKARKSPIPHFRCAHWQRFWTGKGRTEPINKWIEPVFVGFGEKKTETDVIIHKMSKGE